MGIKATADNIRRRKGGYRKRIGLTLLEMLVSIGVLAVLCGLGMYGLSVYQKSGHALKNMDNHRRIAGALLAYTVDNAGNFPYAYEDRSVSSGRFAGQVVTYTRTLTALGYVSNPEIFFSPFIAPWYKGSSALNNPGASGSIPWFYSNYGVNRYGVMPYNEKGYRPANLSVMASDDVLSRMMLVRDTYNPNYDTVGTPRGGGILWFSKNDWIPSYEKTYRGRVYASFADGRVESFDREKLIEWLSKTSQLEGEPIYSKRYTIR